MSVLVWAMTGIAIWHFAVFVPERFWGGIVGAFIQALLGALVIGALFTLVTGKSIDDTSLVTMLVATVGAVIGLAAGWLIGASRGEEPIPGA